jgi:DNA-binding transcriptional MerR regulator
VNLRGSDEVLFCERTIDTPSSHLRFKSKESGARALRIGSLAGRTGTTVATIRYYEQVGLLRPAARSGGQRIYDNEDERRLAFIRRCREFDMSIEAISGLLSLMQRRESCTGARKLAERHLVELRRKLASLQALECTIAGLVTECTASCDGGPAPDCVILNLR